MFKKKIWNRINAYIGISICAIAVFLAPTTTLTTFAAESTDVEICADFKEWRYKVEDGKLYKALYNYSTGQLETDWIYVCDWEGDPPV